MGWKESGRSARIRGARQSESLSPGDPDGPGSALTPSG